MDTLNSTLCLDEKFSTTRIVTTEKPLIENNPDDKFETVLFLPPMEGRKGEGGLRTQGYFKTSLPDKPLITVITVVFNGAKHLEETILSVINQFYDNVEYIIIDGGSTDGTLDIVKKYEGAIDYWLSELDKGISDAFNKGISLSMGKFVGIINAGDYYDQTTIENLRQTQLGESFYYSHLKWLDQDSKLGEIKKVPNRSYSQVIKYCMPFMHPTIFISLETYKIVGLYNTEYKYAMDYDLILRVYHKGFNGELIDKVQATMISGGTHDNNYLSTLKEVKKIAILAGGNNYVANLFLLYTFINTKLPFVTLIIRPFVFLFLKIIRVFR
jgi:glycosyltransferase involved in cell wall biosynthesis